MILVAHRKNGEFFRSQSVEENEIEKAKTIMENDANEELDFEIVTERDYE